MFKSTGLRKHLKQKDPSNEIKKQQLGLLGKHLSRNQMIELTSKIHSWYLFEWDRPATLSLRESPAAIAIWMLPGKNRNSKYAANNFINPFNSTSFLQ